MKKILIIISVILIIKVSKAQTINNNKDKTENNFNKTFSIYPLSLISNMAKVGFEFKIKDKNALKIMPMFGKANSNILYEGLKTTEFGIETHLKRFYEKSNMTGFYYGAVGAIRTISVDYPSTNTQPTLDATSSRLACILGYQLRFLERGFVDLTFGTGYNFTTRTLTIDDELNLLNYVNGVVFHLNLGIGFYLSK